MKKIIKWSLIVIGSIAILLSAGFMIMKSLTKKHSPEVNVALKINDLEMEVFYCQPSKKGREIFGGLVPYGEVWRTGANEPSTFTTNKEISFGGVAVAPGTYSLWTIPGSEKWTVILNNGEYGWGVSGMDGSASRDEQFDVAVVVVAVQELSEVVEKLNIVLIENPTRLELMWDKTKIAVTIE